MVAQIDKDLLLTRPLLVPRRLISYFFFEGRPLTTRGQWFNPIIFRLFKYICQKPPIKSVERPIYIVGTGRSGSTILGVLFYVHPDCGFLNEPKAMWHAIYSHEDLIGSYSRNEAFYRLDEREASHSVQERALRLFGFYLFVTRAHRVVDKYPEMIFRIPFIRAIFPDARFIFLIRNGYDTLQSIASWSLKNRKRNGNEVHDWWGVNRRKWRLLVEQIAIEDVDLSLNIDEIMQFERQEDMAAVEWILSMREGLRNLARWPDVVYPLRYENLTQNPRQELEKLAEFCDLPGDDDFFHYAERVLISVRPRQPVPLSGCIQKAFLNTMRELQYPTDAW